MNKLSKNKFLILVLAITLINACTTVSKKEAISEFLKRNPNYSVLFASPGEGNSDAVYYHFEFKKPSDEKVYKEIWLFIKQTDGNWMVTNREVVKE